MSAGWVGGPKWRMVRSFRSSSNNSATPSRRGSQYACGVPRAYIGDIMAELYQTWKSKYRRRVQ